MRAELGLLLSFAADRARMGRPARLMQLRLGTGGRPSHGRAPRSEAQERLRRRLNLTFALCPS